MYDKHFGLTRHPFRANAKGSDVFVGPQTASTMAGLRKALSLADAAVAVHGPVGTGKTTLVHKALETGNGRNVLVRIGRMRLDQDEILDLLLDALGATPPQGGTVRKFTLFRRILQSLASKDSRLVVLVDDAVRTGAPSLADLEALTAIDAGVSDGANIVLMSESDLQPLLQASELSRLRQRLRLQIAVKPFSLDEVRGYLKHGIRNAGGEFEQLISPDIVAAVYHLSEGVPRVINSLMDATLNAAAEQKQTQVSLELLESVARDDLGMAIERPRTHSDQSAVLPDIMPTASTPDVASGPAPISSEPLHEVAAKQMTTPVTENEPEPNIPELIQDTLPSIATLPQAQVQLLHAAATPASIIVPATDTTPAPDAVATTEAIPAWDRDPTLAELRPDLEALERAMLLAHGQSGDNDGDGQDPEPTSTLTPTLIPEITLDREITAKIEAETEELRLKSAELAEKKTRESDRDKDKVASIAGKVNAQASPKQPARDEPISVSHQDLPDLSTAAAESHPAEESQTDVFDRAKQAAEEKLQQKVAADLAKAKTLEEIDDRMAETLFGEEFSQIAAQVAANPPPEMELQLVADEPEPTSPLAESAAENPPVAPAITQATAGSIPGQAVAADETEREAIEVSLETKANGATGGLDLSASQRLQTVRSLNTGAVTSKNGASPAVATVSTPLVAREKKSQPEPIEEQITTSITQTLRALNMRQMPPVEHRTFNAVDDDDDDDDDDDTKRGFFSRFRR